MFLKTHFKNSPVLSSTIRDKHKKKTGSFFLPHGCTWLQSSFATVQAIAKTISTGEKEYTTFRPQYIQTTICKVSKMQEIRSTKQAIQLFSHIA